MAQGFRTKMTWLHTWSGLILGWLLFAVFVTGTSAYYRGEITLWMKPELHKSQASEKTLDIALSKALESSKKFTNVSISLPNSRTNVISVREDGAISNNSTNSNNNSSETKGQRDQKQNAAQEKGQRGQKQDTTKGKAQAQGKGAKAEQQKGKQQANQKGNQRGGKKRRVPPKYYDATTGELIEQTTKTAGGNFLYRFHFELYSMPRDVARWIVGIATIAMLVAIFTGIVIHKRIFLDVFTFRNKHTTRGWMDAHILPAVAALPFLIMITYSGLLLFTNTLMPWGMKMYYGDDFRAYRDARGQVGKADKKLEEVKKSIQANTKGQDNRGEKTEAKGQRANKSNEQTRGQNQRQQNADSPKGNRGNQEVRGSKQEGFKGQRNVAQNSNKGNKGNSEQRGNKSNASKNKDAKQAITKAEFSSSIKNTNAQRILRANNTKLLNRSQNKNAYRLIVANTNRAINSVNLASTKKEVEPLEISKKQLLEIFDKANKIWPSEVGNFSIKKDINKNSITIETTPKESTTIFSFKRTKEVATFDGKTGKLLSSTTPAGGTSITANTNTALVSLHQAMFASPGLRFLFFLAGVMGVVIAGTGLVLWIQKRKKKEAVKNSFGFKLVDKLNLGTIMGIFIGLAVYFIVNRVTTVANKEELEIAGFFIAWGVSYLYAFVRNTNKAWLEQALFAVVLYASLPIINGITTFDSFAQIYSRDNILIYFDIFFFFMAAVFALISFIIIRKSRKGNA